MSVSCWREIGVGGDSSCPELATHVHCRNCPVHEAAGRDLLARAAPPGYREAWTRALAAAPPPEPVTRAFLVFRLGAEWLAMRARDCDQVGEVRRPHALPHRSRRVLAGIVNVGGQLLPCVQLAALLGVTAGAADRPRRPRLVVLGGHGRGWAFVADEVAGVQHFADDDLGEVPATVAAALAPFVTARATWEGQSVGLLDGERLEAVLDGGALGEGGA